MKHPARYLWLVVMLLLSGCAKPREVVVYTSQDQVFAEPLFKQFEKDTGIKVRALFDGEAVKTALLANRLLAERGRPVCDVFWSNEEFRARQLQAMQVLQPGEGFRQFGYRSRMLVTKDGFAGPMPKSLIELTNNAWRGKVAMAYPLFGTTAAHFLLLKQQWGPTVWEAWVRGLAANGIKWVDGNSAVVRFVSRGEAAVGVTDWDDVAAGQAEGLKVKGHTFGAESVRTPNSVGLVIGAPHPGEAKAFLDYLMSEPVRKSLAAAKALESAELTASFAIDWSGLLASAERDLEFLRKAIVR